MQSFSDMQIIPYLQHDHQLTALLSPPGGPDFCGYILVAEDDGPTREHLHSTLSAFSTVVTAANGEQALHELLTQGSEPCMIISDYAMPDYSGTDLLREVRKMPRFESTPFIMMTPLENDTVALDALEAGASDYVAKPVNSRILYARMETHIRFSALQQRLHSLNEMLSRLASRDELTGAFNRRAMTEFLEREMARSGRYSHPLSVMMLDLDHFKNVNDTYGHPVGDEVLRLFVDRLSEELGVLDRVCRYGGEEFCVILPETNASDAELIAQRLCRHVAAHPVATTAGPLFITTSIGVAELPSGWTGSSAGFVALADEALYRAKQNGRNRADLACVSA